MQVGFGWLSAVEVIGIALGLISAVVLGLAVRRRWLARHGGTFECSLHRHDRPLTDSDATPSTGWVLGVARYSGDRLEWFRFFSLAWWPSLAFPRSEVAVMGHRPPTPIEAAALYSDQEVVTVAVGTGASARRRLLAMTPDSLTGMLSWLESAPPGLEGTDRPRPATTGVTCRLHAVRSVARRRFAPASTSRS